VSATVVTARDYAGPPGRGLPSRLRGLWRGPSRDPAWARPALLALLAVTGLVYLFNLSRNGYANDFYAAAVQAGTRSWKAFFFGSFDASNFITVDKTPASLWVDEIFGRVFGFSSWTLLVPQALEGIGAVWLLFLAVRRWFGPGAGLAAGIVFALTPAAALIFRFNNPDALLTLLMTASAYSVQRSVERRRGALRWLALAGLLLGFAFLAKMLQAFLVLPGFALAYLVAGPVRLPRRIWHVLVAGFAVIAGAGWWVAIAQLWPAGSRPYFGGSTNNNILELALGYNGLGRLDGTETGSIGFNNSSVGGGGAGANFGGSTGIFRLFQAEFGGQVSWLLPAALIALAALVWVARPRGLGRVLFAEFGGPAGSGAAVSGGAAASAAAGAGPVGRMRAFAAVWGGWLLVTGLVFSYAGHHPPLLHGGAGACDRRACRRRGNGAVAGASRLGRAGDGGRRGRRHRLVVLRAARPDARVAAVAALGRARGRCGRGHRAGRHRGACPRSAGGGRRRRAGRAGRAGRPERGRARLERAGLECGGGRGRGDRGRAGRRAGRAAGVHPGHGEYHQHRGDPERRPGGHRRVRRRRRGPRRRRALRRLPRRHRNRGRDRGRDGHRDRHRDRRRDGHRRRRVPRREPPARPGSW
jgi:4-amino-4-deoxy-L-arabinose transferase-like glycosyltransferase